MKAVNRAHERFLDMISASKLILTFVVLSISLTSVTTVMGQNQWTKYSSNPILSAPSWAPGGVYHPRVLYDGKTFRMWFGGLNATGYSVGIGYATSTDGMKWVENAQPVLTAGTSPETWTAYGSVLHITLIGIGSVIWNGSRFMMWYRGNGHGAAIGLATSPDGVAWTKYSGNPVMVATSIDWDLVAGPYVIQVNSTFKMWYTCYNSNLPGDSICYATSNDGITWVKASSPVLEPREASAWEAGYLYSPAVIYDGTVYGMWYTGCNSTSSSAICQIGYATSKDGITWTRDPSNPILSVGPSGGWDAGGIENQCAVQHNGGFSLYYDGYATPTATSGYYIGLAQSPSNFVLPETNSPFVVIGVTMLIVVTALSLSRRRLTNRTQS